MFQIIFGCLQFEAKDNLIFTRQNRNPVRSILYCLPGPLQNDLLISTPSTGEDLTGFQALQALFGDSLNLLQKENQAEEDYCPNYIILPPEEPSLKGQQCEWMTRQKKICIISVEVCDSLGLVPATQSQTRDSSLCQSLSRYS